MCVWPKLFGVVNAQNQNPGFHLLTLPLHPTAWGNSLQRLCQFKKHTQNHQSIFLSNDAECRWSKATEN